MQEEVNQKTIALSVSASKMTAHVLEKAIQTYLQHNVGKKNQLNKGKQSIKSLVKQNTQLTNIEVTDKNIRSFESVAKKYGIDYALKKDSSQKPPRYLVFFKAHDVDVLNMAFQEYTQKQMSKRKVPSLRKNLKKMIDRAKAQSKSREKVKEKNRDRDL